ncbi:MAG: spore germination protein GerW family protein [Methanosphaera sp.]|nr:spore germination protein GerW family protein [Methanosphaera sp.]
MSLEDTIETTLNQIQKVMGANSIVGNTITTKDKVIIPISKVALGFGVGTVDNQSDSETNIGGAGGGGSIDPVAFLVVTDDVEGPSGVQLVSVTPNNTLDDMLAGAGKVLFDIIGSGMSSKNSTSKPKTSTVDNIKTKVKK